MRTKKIAELSMLTAVSLIIFVIELRFPDLSAIPGVKLGLANIITVYAVYRYPGKEVMLIVLSRVILGALFCGNFSVIIYSLSGAVMCLCGMLLLKKIIPESYMWLCSICGALFHNTGQIIAAIIVTRSAAVLVNYPILIISGCIAGLFTGISAGLVLKRLKS